MASGDIRGAKSRPRTSTPAAKATKRDTATKQMHKDTREYYSFNADGTTKHDRIPRSPKVLNAMNRFKK